jgi:hypothetical protein
LRRTSDETGEGRREFLDGKVFESIAAAQAALDG